MLIAQRITPERIFEMKPKLKPFAIREISVENLLPEAGVWVMLDPDDDWGDARDAHVLVMGITKRRVDWLWEFGCRQIIKYPDAARPLHPESERDSR